MLVYIINLSKNGGEYWNSIYMIYRVLTKSAVVNTLEKHNMKENIKTVTLSSFDDVLWSCLYIHVW